MSSPQIKKPRSTYEQRDPRTLRLHDGHKIFSAPKESEIEQLASDINRRGQQHPIEITPDGRIIAGRKRWLAVLRLERTPIWCRVRHDLAAAGEDAVLEHLLADNLIRTHLCPLERARAYVERMKLMRKRKGKAGHGDLRDEVAKSLGASGRSLDRLARVLQAPREVQDAYEDGKLTLVEASSVPGLSPEQQRDLAGDIVRGADPKQALAEISGKDPSKSVAAKKVDTASPAALLTQLAMATGKLTRAVENDSVRLSAAQSSALNKIVVRLQTILDLCAPPTATGEVTI